MSQKICVYAICKNELKFVDQWLKNMSEADYIVVLDTGSTDGTYEKLKEDSRVTRVEQEIITPWRFDAARNRSMDLIPDDADILVCTDFDELFEPGWAQFLRDNWVPGYHTRCHYRYAWKHGEQGDAEVEFTYDKIHNRDYYWVFPVHEVAHIKSGDEKFLEADKNIYLHHWQDTTKSRGSYLPLLQLSVQENPNLSHIHLLLAREYLVLDQKEEALAHLAKTLEIEDIETADNGLVLLQTLYFISLVCFELKDYDECLWYAQRFIQIDNSYREPYFLMARAYNEKHLYSLAEYSVLAGVNYGIRKNNWIEMATSWYLEPDLLLGVIYTNLKKYKEAIPHIKSALQYKPNNTTLLKQYIFVLEELQKQNCSF